MEIVSVKFQSKYNKDEFYGREYSYFAAIPLNVGDIVNVPTNKGIGIARVSRVGVNPEELSIGLGVLRTIESLAGTETENGAMPT